MCVADNAETTILTNDSALKLRYPQTRIERCYAKKQIKKYLLLI